MLKDLRLIDNLVVRMNTQEAIDYIEELHNDSEVNDGVAVVLIDIEQNG